MGGKLNEDTKQIYDAIRTGVLEQRKDLGELPDGVINTYLTEKEWGTVEGMIVEVSGERRVVSLESVIQDMVQHYAYQGSRGSQGSFVEIGQERQIVSPEPIAPKQDSDFDLEVDSVGVKGMKAHGETIAEPVGEDEEERWFGKEEYPDLAGMDIKQAGEQYNRDLRRQQERGALPPEAPAHDGEPRYPGRLEEKVHERRRAAASAFRVVADGVRHPKAPTPASHDSGSNYASLFLGFALGTVAGGVVGGILGYKFAPQKEVITVTEPVDVYEQTIRLGEKDLTVKGLIVQYGVVERETYEQNEKLKSAHDENNRLKIQNDNLSHQITSYENQVRELRTKTAPGDALTRKLREAETALTEERKLEGELRGQITQLEEDLGARTAPPPTGKVWYELVGENIADPSGLCRLVNIYLRSVGGKAIVKETGQLFDQMAIGQQSSGGYNELREEFAAKVDKIFPHATPNEEDEHIRFRPLRSCQESPTWSSTPTTYDLK